MELRRRLAQVKQELGKEMGRTPDGGILGTFFIQLTGQPASKNDEIL